MLASSLLLLACGSPEPVRYPVTGTVVERRGPTEVVIHHDDIEGFMDAMTMPFVVDEASDLDPVKPGDVVAGTLLVGGEFPVLVDLTVTTPAPPPDKPPSLAPGEAVAEGTLFPTTPIRLAAGGGLTMGQGQDGALAVTFIYTRCPLPEYCPLVVSRFQALQPALPEGARLLAVTLDPEHDTKAVLAEFAEKSGASPGRWDFGRVPKEVLFGLAEKAGLKVHGKGLGITHDLVLLILDAEGRLVKRYTDMNWDQTEVVKLLGGTP